jgi:starch synthase (maltosyl-transferring)
MNSAALDTAHAPSTAATQSSDPNSQTKRLPECTSQSSAVAAPRIYYLHPLLAGKLDDWLHHLDRAAALGFDHLLVAPPFMPGATGDLFLAADYDRLHPALLCDKDSAAALSFLAAECRARGLALLLDVALAEVAAGSPVARAHPDLFQSPEEFNTFDPRGVSGRLEAARTRFDASGLIPWFARLLSRWIEAGVSGFRFVGLQHVPAESLRTLLAALRTQRACTAFGWTPGLTPEGRNQLNGAGLDFVFSSFPWWDFRSEWLWRELEELTRLAPVLHAPEAPFARRLRAATHDPALLRPAYRRSLALGATLGAGWMMPMGFDYAALTPMDAAHDREHLFETAQRDAPFDLASAIAEINRVRSNESVLASRFAPRPLSGPGGRLLALLRTDTPDPRAARRAAAILVNTDLEHRVPADRSILAGSGVRLPQLAPVLGDRRLLPGEPIRLDPGEVAVLAGNAVQQPQPRSLPPLRAGAENAARAPRIVIEQVTPSVDDGRFPAKRIAGDIVTVDADVVADGHDQLGVALLWRDAKESEWHEARMRPLGNDRWQANFPTSDVATYLFTIEAWRDAFATFRDELGKKHAAGVDTTVEVSEGVELVSHAGPPLAATTQRLAAASLDEQRRILLAPETAALMSAADPRPAKTRLDPPLAIQAERTAAGFASWYEVFPRSMSDNPERHGTFNDVIRHLPRIRDLGFDVLYFTPIHPIGRVNRKGRNNSLRAGPNDPGSPYAIGAKEGGHDAIHPELGTIEDFRRLRQAATEHGLELALDFAIQCAPDHPWLTEHKDWFAWRPDGSLRYAENPPKKYEDIVNVDFYSKGAIPDLWVALCEVVLYWAAEGVRIFRVDNPHTKPFPFWEWMIGEVRARYPDAIFLAEAFTRPKVMYRLAKLGFSQSYTYFTWRNTKREIADYLTELTTTAPREFFRPQFFVNTPDIDPFFLQSSGRPGFLIRAALAATLSGLWGVYSGFELCEATPLPGREEYMNAEKYEIRAWDWDRPGNITAEIRELNRIRKYNPALQTHLNVIFESVYSEAILYYSKATTDRSNVLLIAVSFDPHNAQEADFELPLWEWGLPDDGALDIEDLLHGTRSTWRGKRQRMRLEPSLPYAIWRARPAI